MLLFLNFIKYCYNYPMRINIIPVELLPDIHLRAEYREILMAPHYYIKSKNSKSGIDINKISQRYTLNKGHAYFWYDKFKFIKDRHNELENEMTNRHFKIRDIDKISTLLDLVPMDSKEYIWTYQEILINVQRILEKIFVKEFIENKPNFYKYKQESRTFHQWCDYLTERLKINKKDISNITIKLEQEYSLAINKG